MLLGLATLTAVISTPIAAWSAKPNEKLIPKPSARDATALESPVLPIHQLADATPSLEADISRHLKRLHQLMNREISPRTDAISTPETGHFLTQGWASWYGPGFEGEQTASGEIYDQNDMTAAHKSLPFGTLVRVTNLENGLSAVVRINDRGPYIEDREIDLSEAAAQILGTVQSGVAPVRLERLN